MPAEQPVSSSPCKVPPGAASVAQGALASLQGLCGARITSAGYRGAN